VTEIEFQAWPKTPRLFRPMIITEKIDGTNSAVIVTEDGEVAAQSRTRLITPGKSTDNFGFAAWVEEHEDSLLQLLGPGRHFGEWWGKGIQRNYGLDERRFSLFNVGRFGTIAEESLGLLHTVPVLYQGEFSTPEVEHTLNVLAGRGSQAAPGFMKPEGVVVYHAAARASFKVLLENDDIPKGLVK
jgi:hypothetical protein